VRILALRLHRPKRINIRLQLHARHSLLLLLLLLHAHEQFPRLRLRGKRVYRNHSRRQLLLESEHKT
jgi:hypothetical protein